MKGIYFTTIILLVICCQQRRNTESDSPIDTIKILTDTTKVVTRFSENPKTKFVQKLKTKESFVILEVEKLFYKNNPWNNGTSYATFDIIFSLINQTNKVITEVTLNPSISMKFKNEEPTVYAPSYDDFNEFQRSDISWKPYDTMRFQFRIHGIEEELFKRTPISANYFIGVFAKSITIDDEAKYNDLKTIDALKDWNKYQTELGLR